MKKQTEYGTPANEGQLTFMEEMREVGYFLGGILVLAFMVFMCWGSYKLVMHFYDRSPTTQKLVNENLNTAKDLLIKGK